MIEVEKKFQPTEEQLAFMLQDAEFVGDIVNHDTLYDYPDYRMFKKQVRLRNRNGRFEMKIPVSSLGDTELEDEEEIKKYFNISEPLKDFIDKNLIVLMQITTHRKKYKKELFTIDVDTLVECGYNVCEIELLVEREDQVGEAQDKIIKLAESYKFDIKNLPSKREMHLKLFRPDLYQKFYGDK